MENYNSKKWSRDTIQQVWEKATVVYSHDSSEYRKDNCGAWIQFSQHGNRGSQYGWEIDHITPVSLGGTDVLSNLQPLHWQNNVAKGDSRTLKCAVR